MPGNFLGFSISLNFKCKLFKEAEDCLVKVKSGKTLAQILAHQLGQSFLHFHDSVKSMWLKFQLERFT